VGASIAHVLPAGMSGGQPGAGDLEDALFTPVREHAESMISWARSVEALALEHGEFEDRTITDGVELMRLLAASRDRLTPSVFDRTCENASYPRPEAIRRRVLRCAQGSRPSAATGRPARRASGTSPAVRR
jgi:hypothetical protein